MKYKVGDRIQLKQEHSEGDNVTIEEILGNKYKIYIPYWGYFTVTDEDIIGIGTD